MGRGAIGKVCKMRETEADQYEAIIRQKGKIWSEAALSMAVRVKPDWQQVERLSHQAVIHAKHFELILSRIRPGWQVWK
jgi:hypothetical protein